MKSKLVTHFYGKYVYNYINYDIEITFHPQVFIALRQSLYYCAVQALKWSFLTEESLVINAIRRLMLFEVSSHLSCLVFEIRIKQPTLAKFALSLSSLRF